MRGGQPAGVIITDEITEASRRQAGVSEQLSKAPGQGCLGGAGGAWEPAILEDSLVPKVWVGTPMEVMETMHSEPGAHAF